MAKKPAKPVKSHAKAKTRTPVRKAVGAKARKTAKLALG